MEFNKLWWNEHYEEFQMLIKQGDPICTEVIGDDGEKLVMVCVCHTKGNAWVVSYVKPENASVYFIL